MIPLELVSSMFKVRVSDLEIQRTSMSQGRVREVPEQTAVKGLAHFKKEDKFHAARLSVRRTYRPFVSLQL